MLGEPLVIDYLVGIFHSDCIALGCVGCPSESLNEMTGFIFINRHIEPAL
jgi:hypothetical protein